MNQPTRLTLLCLTVFLVLFPLVLRKPGLPGNLKADEPAYYLMALSLAYDGDLRCEQQDYRRLFDEYPYREVRNLILMSDDGWKTVYFGKPYIYSLFAAPAAALFGASGIVAFNMAMLMGLVWMGVSYLRKYNSDPISALFSCGFFLLSSGFAYVFWIQPEVFNMTSVALSLYLAFHDFEWQPWRGRFQRLMTRLFTPSTIPAWSGAALSLAIYNKPVLGAVALPAVWMFWQKRGWRGVVAFGLGLAIMLGLVVGLSVLLTGHEIAYLGVSRGGVKVENPQHVPTLAVAERVKAASATQNSWSWIFRLPKIEWSQLREDAGYFLWGRHTGLFLYTPFALLALILFLIHNRRSLGRWLVVAALAVVALFFFIWIPFNWHGGGGAIGNRYFINAYPAFLFLVTAIRPVWTTLVGYAAGGLLLSPILFTPFGAPVKSPTLQAHVRNPPYGLFPLELSLQGKIPGYRGFKIGDVWFQGRRDVFKRVVLDEMWIQGATKAEIWAQSLAPLESMVFTVRNLAPGNRVRLKMEGSRRTLRFSDTLGEEGETRWVELRPKSPTRVRDEKGKTLYMYKLLVSSQTGEIVTYFDGKENQAFYLGAAVAYLGPRGPLDAEIYELAWGEWDVPARVTAGEEFEVRGSLENRSSGVWPAAGPTRVRLSYHWLDGSGGMIEQEGRRSPLPHDVAPGQRVSVVQQVLAPDRPGYFSLALDPVRERVAWFSDENDGNTFVVHIEVLPAAELLPDETP
jgi:hypothetical protein